MERLEAKSELSTYKERWGGFGGDLSESKAAQSALWYITVSRQKQHTNPTFSECTAQSRSELLSGLFSCDYPFYV